MHQKITGLIAATYTPMHDNGKLNLKIAPAIVRWLKEQGVQGIYICGSTGEGVSLTCEERRAVTEAYVQAAGDDLITMVQVGHTSLSAAQKLAEHAQQCRVDVVSATCPFYFPITSVNTLVESMAEVAQGAPETPFYYYHIPVLTRTQVSIVEFLAEASERIPNLAGLKYTDTKVHEYQQCLLFADRAFDVLWGCDEMLLSALAVGAKGAVGSTYNIAAPLYNRIINIFESGDIAEVQKLQGSAVQLIATLMKHPFHPAMKQVMGFLGMPCGPCRNPLPRMETGDVALLRRDLQNIGFFDWDRSHAPMRPST